MDNSANQRPIVVGVDGSRSSIDALRKAAELADVFNAPIEAITAWQFPITYDQTLPTGIWSPEGEAADTLSRAIHEAFPSGKPENLTTQIAAGPPAAVLIKKSETASMLVLGSRGRGGFAGLLLGSVSTACTQHAHCPVLVMHSMKSQEDASDTERLDSELTPTA
ncbi:universal stress protein [Microbacterium pumilum]|uniref:Universal stress protein n=1 Tax=Microbacterium pumilum TaxID=344165 RepID=A0ABN2RS95_9MICO